MIQLFKKKWDEKPLGLILVIASFFRILSAIFSKGFGMHDDHFLVIEIAQAWVDQIYNNWLPFKHSGIMSPTGHSLFYPGLHFLFFRVLEHWNIIDPQIKMYYVRFLHAAFSLLIVYYGYKITLFYSELKVARIVGLLLAILWFMPMLSVRNLVEVVCIPFLLIATWLIIKNTEYKKTHIYLLAGLVVGIAFSIRFQSFLFLTGIGLVLLLEKKWKGALAFGLGAGITIGLIQGLTDYLIWKRPFAEFIEYVHFNMTHPNDFVTNGFETYPLLISCIILPPIGLFFWFGYFRNWKKQLYIFLPSFLFFVFHSSFPNKQERFIIPFIPFFIILGCIGWFEFVSKSSFWSRNPKLLRNCWRFFWILNTIPLLVVSVAYSKRNRVEAMTYLSHKKVQTIIVDDSNNSGVIMPPLFYMRKFQSNDWGVIPITKSHPLNEALIEVNALDKKNYPNYAIFWGPDNLQTRVDSLKKYFPTLHYEATIEPGLIDIIVHYMNPVNDNQTTYIYKIDGPAKQ
jgi:hypothetical protein